MQWLAIYDDDSSLMQYKEDGTENSYFDIDRSRLTHFVMLEGDKAVLVVEFERRSQKLIYRKRTFVDGNGKLKGVVYLVGWHENINGISIKCINYIYPDGKTVLAGAKDDIELLDCETLKTNKNVGL